jgi:hypothetical protein
MGIRFSDKYSLLHFATGIIAYYWSVPFMAWFIIHLLYEYLENTTNGMFLINKISMWPGGKERADSIINSIGDQFYGLLGYALAYYIVRL